MKKILINSFFVGLFMVFGVNAKVLVLAEYYYYNSNQSYVDRYISDVKKIEFKKVDLQVMWNCTYCGTTQERCEPLWDTIRNAYQNSLGTGDSLEGVVIVGHLPVAWRVDSSWVSLVGPEDEPDDRYFMDIFNIITHTCYNSDNDVWNFDAVTDLFTTYKGDNHADIWVSRIMANQIRGLRDGLNVMDEYTIINNYFDRLHERMTQPAKVPPRGFAMGGITEWTDHDAIAKLGMMNLNLRWLFKFDNPENTPANWLLQLTKGPYGGTTLGAFNGQRYDDIGKNNLTNTFSTRYDWKTSTNVSTVQDTFGYEWAGIFEHSQFNQHSFNFAPGSDNKLNLNLNGQFRDQTNGKLWCDANWLQYDPEYYYGTSYNYNPYYDPNPMNLDNGYRFQQALFKIEIPATGLYSVLCHYKPNSANDTIAAICAYSMPPNHNYQSFSSYNILLNNINMRPQSPSDTFGVWKQLGQCNFFLNDTAVIILFNDNPAYTSGNLIADAMWLQPVSGQCPNCYDLVIDNEYPGFGSNNHYDRAFLDMQDEDPVYHKAISKVLFFISAGCNVGNYYDCSDPNDWYHEYLRSGVLNCLGLLYGMAHSGLISLTSAISYPGSGNPFSPFTMKLAGIDSHSMPNTFGDALLDQYNISYGFSIPLVLIGAGTLRADSTAYVPYGTLEIKLTDQQITGTFNHTYPDTLVWLENFNVTATGNCTIVAKEVRIFAESDLKGTVDIKAQ